MNIDIERKTSQIDRRIVEQLESHCEGGRLSVLTKMDEVANLMRPIEFQQVRMGYRDSVDEFSYE
jgi:GTP-binding protein EngB required for normal cell division